MLTNPSAYMYEGGSVLKLALILNNTVTVIFNAQHQCALHWRWASQSAQFFDIY